MIRTKWAVDLRNQLSDLAMQCDSSTAIEVTGMSESERKVLKGKLMDCVQWIDKKILPRK